MTKIADIFERPIDRTIEEVIKVDQANEQAVHNEIEEYIATDSIRDQFHDVYKEIAAGRSAPREGIGIWVSGFFGSGKSSFAKILGYTVANRKVGASTASELFKKALADSRVVDALDLVNKSTPFHAVIFDVSMDRGVRAGNDRLTEILYRALLRELGYAEDLDLAELEITLEGDGRLKQFEDEFQKLHEGEWTKRRQLGLAINEASATLNKLMPKTYSTPESYAHSVGIGRADIDPNKLANRAFELCARRQPGKAIIFIIDEVGQYVSRSVDKMLDLQAIIQSFGVQGKNRTERGEAVSPFWIVVTSQEKLNEVVTALDSKKIELAKLYDRFRLMVDLKQSDITEVTSERVLKKKKSVEPTLEKLFTDNAARIQQCCKLENSNRNLSIDAKSFAQLYPYLPYQIDLCIDIVAGLRLRRGAHKHVGGSNRTIIKQAQQMMINDRTRLADQPIGRLVTLDLVYELLEVGNLLPSEVSREVATVAKRIPDNPMAHRVVKAIALLEPVKDLPRTPANLAAVLHPAADAQPLLKEVEAALTELEKGQFIRRSEEGYKLLTLQEKSWESDRNAKEPREADRNRVHRETLKDIFSEPGLRAYKYNDRKRFRNSLAVNGEDVDTDGDLPLEVVLTTPDELKEATEETRNKSVADANKLFWVATISDDIRELVTDLYRSREMVSEYDRLGAQQKLTPEQQSCLADEKSRRERIQRELRTKLQACLQGGQAFFGGVKDDIALLGQNLRDALFALLERAIPVLYPKLDIGVLNLSGGEPLQLLQSTNLSGLPQLFFDTKPERSLVIKQADRFVPNLGCELCRELLDYLRREHAYGNRVTGKMLENHFSGLGYAWDKESIHLGMAILFRGGAIEVTHQGRKYSNYADPSARPPFTTTPAFRSASFAPRESLDLKVLANAARIYEEIAGREVDIEEGAIAQAFKQVAAADREKLLPLEARLSALKLPGAKQVVDQLQWVVGILEMSPDDCVRTLAGDGKAYQEGRRVAATLEKSLTDKNVDALQTATQVLREQWPILEPRCNDSELVETANKLDALVESDEALNSVETIRFHSDALSGEYRKLYEGLFEKRRAVYREALDQIKGRPEWLDIEKSGTIPPDQREALIGPLRLHAETELDFPPGATVCRRTHATVPQMESDIAAVESIARDVLLRLFNLAKDPDEKIERVSIAKLYPGRITTKDDLDEVIKDLRKRLEPLLAQKTTIILE